MGKVGRKIPKEERKKIIEQIKKFLREGRPVKDACFEAGIDPSTLYRWMEKDEKIAIEINKAQMFFRRKIRDKLLRVITILEQRTGLLNTKGKRDKLNTHLLKLYLEHLRWLAEKKLSDEFYEKRVQVVEGNLKHSVEDDIRAVRELVKSIYEIKDSTSKKRKGKKKKAD